MAELSSPATDPAVLARISAIEMNAGAYPTPAAMAAALASIPVAGSAVPPGVADTGAIGSAAPYARMDHTHASKARKQRVTGVSAATYVWTYPTAFGTGVVPICQATAEDPANSATDSYNVQVSGAPTATSVTMRIIRQTSGLFGLLLGAIGFNPTPGNINLHLVAFEP